MQSTLDDEKTILKNVIIQKKKELELLRTRGIDKFIPNVDLELNGKAKNNLILIYWHNNLLFEI